MPSSAFSPLPLLLRGRLPLSSTSARTLRRPRQQPISSFSWLSSPRPAAAAPAAPSRRIIPPPTPKPIFRCPRQPFSQQRWHSARPPPERHRNQPYIDTYAHRVSNNEHYVRLQAAKPLQPPSPFTMKAVASIAISAAVLFYFYNLETVPVSGRTRFNVYSSDKVKQVGEWEYRRLLAELEEQGARILPDWDPRTARVKQVMRRLIPFSGMHGEAWEIYVIDSPRQANAFVLPGGKVFVFSGILNLARTDSQLATVLGHEIAHNVADHVGERLSASIGTNMLLYSVLVLAGLFGIGPLILWMGGSWAADVAFGYPMSRMQESEADYIGLMMMSEACYDPREAVEFWARMERAGKGSGMEVVPEWASTHPSNLNRIKKIQEWLPKAIDKRSQSDCTSTTAFADLFRKALETGQFMVVW